MPWLEAPSPKKQTPTWSVPRNLAESPAPVQMPNPPPTIRHVGNMHRAALAAAIAGFFAHDLGHHAVELAALGQTVTMTAVGAGDIVVVSQGGTGANCYGLLADIEVCQPGHQAAGIHIPDAFLKETDFRHFAVHEPEFVGIYPERGSFNFFAPGFFLTWFFRCVSSRHI